MKQRAITNRIILRREQHQTVSASENQDVSRKIEQNTRLMTDSLEELAEMVGRWRVEQAGPV